jgi:heat-inducible transcriptional repressor
METASHVLSALSQNVGIVVSPSLADNRLNHIEFVLLPDKRILVVLVSTANIIHNKVIASPTIDSGRSRSHGSLFEH